MSRFARYFSHAAAVALLPMVATAVGFKTLRDRERPVAPDRMSGAQLARIPRPPIDPTRPTVAVVLGADLTEITDALGPYEMFARVGTYNVVTVAPERQPGLLTGGLRILPHYALAELDTLLGGRAPAIVVVPNLPNAPALRNRPTIEWLRRKAAQGALMHSWCKGAMALAETGLLDGKEATAHWGDIAALEARYPRVRWVRGVRWVEHGQFIMSAGITSGIDASLRAIIRTSGDSTARRVAGEIRYPNYRFAIDPRVEQYRIRVADAVLLANEAFRFSRPSIGVGMYDGIGEFDLSNLYDAHVHVSAADVETIATRGVVVTAHGLTVFPSLVTSGSAAQLVRGLQRVIVPGAGAAERGAMLIQALRQAGAAPELIHAADPTRFGLEPVLEDLARTSDVPTATMAMRRMEYRSDGIVLAGSSLPWRPLWNAVLLALAGLAATRFIRRLRRARLLAAAVILAGASPSLVHAQRETIPPGTRIRVDLHREDVSRIRRSFTQSVAGTLVGERGDTLLLAVRGGTGELRVPRTALRDIHVSRGTPGRFRSALLRAWLPALGGAAIAAGRSAIGRGDAGVSPGRAALSGAASSAAFAGAIGFLFPAERWRKVHAGARPKVSESRPVVRSPAPPDRP